MELCGSVGPSVHLYTWSSTQTGLWHPYHIQSMIHVAPNLHAADSACHRNLFVYSFSFFFPGLQAEENDLLGKWKTTKRETSVMVCLLSPLTKSGCISCDWLVYYLCSDLSNIRLMGGATRCDGELEMKLDNVWKPVDDPSFDWNLRTAAVVCRQLDCGSAVSAKIKYSNQHVWKIKASSLQSGFAPRDSMKPRYSSSSMEITCSGNTVSDTNHDL